MIKVKDKRELKKLPPQNNWVLVEDHKKIYRCIDNEWIEKAYFSLKEARDILGFNTDKTYYFLEGLGMIQATGRRSNNLRINVTQLRMLMKAKSLHLQNFTIPEIKERL